MKNYPMYYCKRVNAGSSTMYNCNCYASGVTYGTSFEFIFHLLKARLKIMDRHGSMSYVGVSLTGVI